MDGVKESWQELSEFLATDAEQEIRAFFSALEYPRVRVMVVRHGMGDHNTYAGIGSITHEDADLNECGLAQAERVGQLLRAEGVTAALGLAVVSPFTRTLQTARHLLGPDIGAPIAERREARAERFGYEMSPYVCHDRTEPLETIVQPLCAEDTFFHSHVWRGNRGSTAAELARRPEFDIFDFNTLEKYCEEHCVTAKDPTQAGKWWHHGPHGQETGASFRRRMVRLKRWLGGLCLSSDRGHPLRVVMVCHGGVMQEAFQVHPNAPNCGFRVFDIEPSGRTLHASTGSWLEETDLSDPAFQVFSVVQKEKRVNGHHLYDIELGVGDETFVCSKRESELREGLRDMVRRSMPSEVCERYRLRGRFPRWSPVGHADPSIYIQDYLEQLAVAMGDGAFDAVLARRIDAFLLGGRLEQCRRFSTEEDDEEEVELEVEGR